MKTTIRKIGDALVMDLTAEMLSLLGAGEGDMLHVARTGDGGLRISKRDPTSALDAAEAVMDENSELLRKLAAPQG